jgi:hypothetical protein
LLRRVGRRENPLALMIMVLYRKAKIYKQPLMIMRRLGFVDKSWEKREPPCPYDHGII